MKELPTEPGLWHREGKNYRVWKRDDGSIGAEHIDANGMIGAYYGNDLPTGNWQPLAPPVTLSEAREEFLDWLAPNAPSNCTMRGGVTCSMIADKAAELFGRVERSEKPFSDQQVDEAQSRLRGWARRERPSCRILSEGDRCTCLLCDIDGLAFRARQITDLKATIARLEVEVAEAKEKTSPSKSLWEAGQKFRAWLLVNPSATPDRIHKQALKFFAEIEPPKEQPEIIIGNGQAVTEEQDGWWLRESRHGDIDTVRLFHDDDDEFMKCFRYMRCPTFPPRLTEAAKIIQHNTRDDEAMQLIRAERQRQISAEGWSADHDEAHHNGELEDAALCYWHCATKPGHVIRVLENNSDTKWPWESRWFKPFKPSRGEFPEVDNVRCLVKAGALMLAEIDRLKRTGAEVHCGYGQQVWDIAADLAKLLPPRPTFTPPPKPELVLVRWHRPNGGHVDMWTTKTDSLGGGYRGIEDGCTYTRVELLDETTGEVRG